MYEQSNVRKLRSYVQKLFLIESCPITNPIIREYMIMGSTGNVYKVTIKDKPSCTCPDHTKNRKRCKHIFFVLMRIMKVTSPDTIKYSDDELMEMFTAIPQIANTLCVDNSIKNKYDKTKSGQGVDEKVEVKGMDDICPICLDDMNDGSEYDYCKYGCNKVIHTLCFNMWCKKNEALCVHCRSPWKNPNTNSEYINLN